MNRTWWWLIFGVCEALGLLGDVAMKRAGSNGGTDWVWFGIGFCAYSSTSIGWFVLLRQTPLSTFGILFPLVNAVGLIGVGVTVFHEHLDARTWCGVALGLLALVLLSR